MSRKHRKPKQLCIEEIERKYVTDFEVRVRAPLMNDLNHYVIGKVIDVYQSGHQVVLEVKVGKDRIRACNYDKALVISKHVRAKNDG